MYSIGMAATFLGICVKTLRRWHEKGLITCYRTLGGHRRFPLDELFRVLEERQDKQDTEHVEMINSYAIYGRVSSHKQHKRGDLDRQLEKVSTHALEQGHVIYKIYKDVGSGLNMNRKGLWAMIRDAKRGRFSTIYINFKDRLTRFGFKYLETYLSEFNVSITCVNELDDKTPESELVEDLVAIVHSFSGKLYRMRRAENLMSKNQKSLKL
jgi:excisionase family DNA binding protein